MVCPICKFNYGLWTYERFKDGMRETRYLWVPKDLIKKAMEIRTFISKKKENIVSIA